MNWKKAIKTLRERLLLTQTEFAKMLGVSFTSINRWETGKFEPSLNNSSDLRTKNNRYVVSNEKF